MGFQIYTNLWGEMTLGDGNPGGRPGSRRSVDQGDDCLFGDVVSQIKVWELIFSSCLDEPVFSKVTLLIAFNRFLYLSG